MNIIDTISLEDVLKDPGHSEILSRTHDRNLAEMMCVMIHETSKIKMSQLTPKKSQINDIHNDLLNENKGLVVAPTSCPSTYPPTTSQEEDQADEPESGTMYDDSDDQIYVSKEKETSEQYAKRYPNLPYIRCLRELYVSTLSPGYLNSLYITEAEAFPKNWWDLKTKDPKQAWYSLNQTIIPYTNMKWSKQGIDINSAETIVDPYSVSVLKEAIISTIRQTFEPERSEEEKKQSSNTGKTSEMSEVTSRLEGVASRLEEVTRVLNSSAVKSTNRELISKPAVPSIDPTISLTSYQLPRETTRTQFKPDVYVYEEEIVE